MKASLRIAGDRELAAVCQEIGYKPMRRAMRASLSAAATPVNKQAKREVNVETRLLQKAIAKKMVTTKDGRVLALVGIRKGAKFEGVGPDGRPRKPHKYGHIVAVKTKNFLKIAHEATKAQSQGIARQKLGERLEVEAAKLAARKGAARG